MSKQLSRRMLLSLTAGATASLAGCATFTGSNSSTPTLNVGDTAELSDDQSITLHTAWVQQTLIYREGPYNVIGGDRESQLVCIYTSGGTENGTFTLQVQGAEYSAATSLFDADVKRVIQDNLEKNAPTEDAVFRVFEVPETIDTDFVEIVYKTGSGTARWRTSDSIRARLHFPPQLTVDEPSIPTSVPREEQTTFSVTIENTGGSDAMIRLRHGILELDSDFPLETYQIESGSSKTVTQTVTPQNSDRSLESVTYILDWGLGYIEQEITLEDASSNDSENGNGETTV